MTWIAGTSRAGYDYVGPWEKRIDLAIAVPDAIRGDPSWPGDASPGTFSLGEEYVSVRLILEVIS